MSEETKVHPFLKAVPRARYERNFLRQVVCELRFPTLFELNSPTPDQTFALALRKSYPHHSHQITETEVNGGSFERIHTHVFKSKNLDWTVTLRPSAVTIETSAYTCFTDLVERLKFLIDAAAKVIDSDFFTRLGLRYINTVPINLVGADTKEFEGWINDALAGVLLYEDLGLLNDYSGRVAGRADFGGFLFQHGVGYHPVSHKPEYYLDLDFSRDNVEMNDVLTTLDTLHRNQFAMFMWALGPRAKEYLGPSVLKEE